MWCTVYCVLCTVLRTFCHSVRDSHHSVFAHTKVSNGDGGVRSAGTSRQTDRRAERQKGRRRHEGNQSGRGERWCCCYNCLLT
ncbi:hypothetical protein IWX92DRAFT_357898 [Phyllosticta citricarpa]